MRYKRWCMFLLTVLSLAGCATSAQRQFEQLQVQYQSALRTLDSCDPVDKSEAFSRLKERFIVESDDIRTVEKLSLKAYVTEQEAKDLTELSILRRPCNKRTMEAFSNVHPAYVDSLGRMFLEADTDLAKAINKELTIGKVNRRTLDRSVAWQTEFNQIGQQIQSQLNHEHQNELLQRQNTAQALQNGAQALQNSAYQQQQLENQRRLSNPAARSTTTNCRFIGSSYQCTTY